MDLILILVRTAFFYFLIFIVYRMMGKREVGQLGIIDLIVSILIAELACISIENYDNNIMQSIIPIITLLFLQVTLATLSLKLPKLRIFLDGNPSVIIKDGKVNYKEMIKQKYNLDDLMVQLREKGSRSIDEVEYAILESNGTLSIFKRNKKKTPLPLPIILDSHIQNETLKELNKDRKWLYNILKKKDIKLEEVFYAFYKDNNVFIIKKDELLS
jgi:uncharacterized membrane protein YcaP (DUF421 family)